MECPRVQVRPDKYPALAGILVHFEGYGAYVRYGRLMHDETRCLRIRICHCAASLSVSFLRLVAQQLVRRGPERPCQLAEIPEADRLVSLLRPHDGRSTNPPSPDQ